MAPGSDTEEFVGAEPVAGGYGGIKYRPLLSHQSFEVDREESQREAK
jgi:hypothetical protein